MVRLANLFGVEFGLTTKTYIQKMVEEVTMVKWMCGHTLSKRIKSNIIEKKNVGVAL